MRFEFYERPQSIAECLELLRHHGADARILAGGTDVIPRLRARKWTAKALIDITRIPELTSVELQNDGVFLGSAVTLRTVQNCDMLQGAHAVLRSGAGHVSSLQVRNIATLGGNVCNASPSADTVPALVLLDAQAIVEDSEGNHTMPVRSLFTGPGKTVLSREQLLTGFFLPPPQKNTGAVYCKYAIRGDSDISIVGAGALLTVDGGKITKAKIALAAVAPTIFCAEEAERLLLGSTCSNTLFEEAAVLCAKACEPISDQRATADYRREMVRVWVREALSQAAVQYHTT